MTPPDTPTGVLCRRVRIPDNPDFIQAVNELLSRLTFTDFWQQREDGISPDDAAVLASKMYVDYAESDDYCMLGVVIFHARSTLPPNMLRCDGTEYSRVDYPDLYAVLDDEFIVDADTFVTPLIEGVFPIGATSAPGGDYPINAAGGEASHALTVGELATHGHGVTDPGHNHTQNAHGHGVTDPGHNHTQNAHNHDITHTHTFFGRTNGLVPGTSNRTAMADTSGANSTPSTQTQSTANSGNATPTNNASTTGLTVNNATPTNNATTTGLTVDNAGSSTPHNNIPPYRAFPYAIIAK